MKTIWISRLNSTRLLIDTSLKHFKNDPLWVRLTVLFGVLVINERMPILVAVLWFAGGH